jgi:hypothetical protein
MARRYRKIEPQVWKDEKFRRLGPEEKLIALYCITAQSNRVGIFYFSFGMAVEDMKLPADTFPERFANVCKTLSWEWDEAARVLYIPTWWKYNHPDNPKDLKGNLKDLGELPQTPLLAKFCGNLRYLLPTYHETFQEGSRNVTDTSPERMPYQEQEQEQKQKQEQEQEQEPLRGVAAGPLPSEFLEAWNAIPQFVHAKKMTSKRVATLRARIADKDWSASWRQALERASRLPFCCGAGEKGWHADIDWFLRPDTVTKILEGKYDRLRNGKPDTAELFAGIQET